MVDYDNMKKLIIKPCDGLGDSIGRLKLPSNGNQLNKRKAKRVILNCDVVIHSYNSHSSNDENAISKQRRTKLPRLKYKKPCLEKPQRSKQKPDKKSQLVFRRKKSPEQIGKIIQGAHTTAAGGDSSNAFKFPSVKELEAVKETPFDCFFYSPTVTNEVVVMPLQNSFSVKSNPSEDKVVMHPDVENDLAQLALNMRDKSKIERKKKLLRSRRALNQRRQIAYQNVQDCLKNSIHYSRMANNEHSQGDQGRQDAFYGNVLRNREVHPFAQNSYGDGVFISNQNGGDNYFDPIFHELFKEYPACELLYPTIEALIYLIIYLKAIAALPSQCLRIITLYGGWFFSNYNVSIMAYALELSLLPYAITHDIKHLTYPIYAGMMTGALTGMLRVKAIVVLMMFTFIGTLVMKQNHA